MDCMNRDGERERAAITGRNSPKYVGAEFSGVVLAVRN
jgi:hypothetical protein